MNRNVDQNPPALSKSEAENTDAVYQVLFDLISWSLLLLLWQTKAMTTPPSTGERHKYNLLMHFKLPGTFNKLLINLKNISRSFETVELFIFIHFEPFHNVYSKDRQFPPQLNKYKWHLAADHHMCESEDGLTSTTLPQHYEYICTHQTQEIKCFQ